MNLTQNTKVLKIMNQEFGENWIEEITNIFGYQTKTVNKDYYTLVGPEKIQDPEWEKPEDFDLLTDVAPMIKNPDHDETAAEKIIDNPESREKFLDSIIMSKGLDGVMDRVLEAKVNEFKLGLKSQFSKIKEEIKQA